MYVKLSYPVSIAAPVVLFFMGMLHSQVSAQCKDKLIYKLDNIKEYISNLNLKHEEDIEKLTVKQEKYEANLTYCNAQIANLTAQSQRQAREIANLTEQMQRLETENEEQKKEIGNLTAKQDDQKKTITAQGKKIANLTGQIERLEDETKDLGNNITTLAAHIRDFKIQNQGIHIKLLNN